MVTLTTNYHPSFCLVYTFLSLAEIYSEICPQIFLPDRKTKLFTLKSRNSFFPYSKELDYGKIYIE